MTSFKIILRLIYVIYIILKFNLLSLISNKTNIQKKSRKKHLRFALEKLGPIFIKLGQILSTRIDLLSNDTINELKKLQTHTYPIDFNNIKKVIETSFNKKTLLIFKKINENPIASASIAQIHTGILLNNKKVIIKVLKPHIETLIHKDITILKILESLIHVFLKKLNRLKLKEVIIELENTLKIETNLKQEAANLTKIKNNFKKNIKIYLPNVHWNLITKKILILEYIDGINITNTKKLIKECICINTLSIHLIDLFFTQILKHNFFHADLHPGNILISKNNSNMPVIIFIDFGITSNINKEEKIYLAENILAFSQKNYRKIVYLHLKAQTIQTTASIDSIENDLCCIFEPILNKKIKDISFYQTISEIFSLTKKTNMQLQPRLMLFQKSLLTIESICRQINPNLNLWKTTRQSIEKIFLKTIIINKIKKNIAKIINTTDIHSSKKNNKLQTSFLNYLLSDNLLSLILGYLIGLSIFITVLKYYQIMLFFI